MTSEALPPPPAPEPIPQPEFSVPELPEPREFRGDFEPIRARELAVPEELPPLPEPIAPEPIRIDIPMREEEDVEAIAPSIPPKSFIAIDDFRNIIDNSNMIRAKIMEAEDLIKHLSTIKTEEEKLFDKWRSNLEHIEKKLNYVDKVIEKAQG